MRSLLEAGVHFGHRTRRWNPKMKPFIFTERNGIHIIDLQQTITRLNQAYEIVKNSVAAGGIVLFVGTKRQAQESLVAEARRCNMPYVEQRWLGGTLTNWPTIRQRIDYLLEIERQQARGEFSRLIKKEALQLEREIVRLNHRLGGLKEMRRLPNLLFIVDVRRDDLAVKEANILGIPIIAMVDTNCDPDPIDHVIPCNDDAIRAVKLIVATIANAALDGQTIYSTIQAEEEEVTGGIEGVEDQERYLGPSTLAKLQAAAAAEILEDEDDAYEYEEEELDELPLAAEAAALLEEAEQVATAVEPAPDLQPPPEEPPSPAVAVTEPKEESKMTAPSVSTADIKLLRESTGAGVLDCKKALQETGGDIDKAIEFLRKKGLSAAAKKASREANEGLVSAQVSADGQTGILLEVNCETDFVARTDDFKNFAAALLRQVETVPTLDTVERLLDAPYIDDPTKTVATQLTDIIAKIGENMRLRQVARFTLEGEGMLDAYIHPGSRVGVLVEVAGGDPTDPQFTQLTHDVALQIAAAAPRYVTAEQAPADVIEAEKEIYRAQLAEDNKPPEIKERIVEGKLKKWYTEVALLNQEFVKDNKLTIAQLLTTYGKAVGRQIEVKRFARFELGN
jgi:small subunit ribosomal protein S2